MLKQAKEQLKRSVLFKAVSFNSINVLAKLITGFAVSKFMAVFIGPSGMALSGNLSNFMQSFESLSALGLQNGIVKYIAESKGNKLQFKKVVSAGFLISLGIGVLTAFILLLFSSSLSQFVFGTFKYSILFKVSGVMMPFFALHIFFIAVITGLKKIKDLVVINIVGYVFSALLIVFLMGRNQLDGALLSIVLTPFILFLSLLTRIKLAYKIIKNISFVSTSKPYVLKITSFFSMTLFSGVMFPIIFLLIRNHIIDTVGVSEAGYWEATRKISNYYMLFIYTLFNIYLLPTLSEDLNNTRFKSIVSNFYKSILPVVLLGFIGIYFLRFFIIRVVFTNEFLSMQELFGWQLIGDFFRIISLTMAYQFFAKKMIFKYLTCEIILMALIYLSSIYLVNYLSVLGAVKAHAFSYIFYTLLMFYVFKNELFKRHAAK
ncbi:O-antigen translocase [Gelatiniphilus marinus]|uniref:O-antigen translocase n=1 Tax=Gelatiniphilus marinus TaxID=1759464 RepID=A0ABW5JNF1_9FLAO